MRPVARYLAAALAAVAVVVVVGLLAARHFQLLVPAWVVWDEGIWTVDLDGDGADECVDLTQRSCMVRDAGGTKLYTSDPSWQVSQVCLGDVDRDGLPELVMLTWRRGNYGTSRPFWDTDADLRMTEHLFVLTMRDGFVRQRWMGHELGAPVVRVDFEAPGALLLTTTDGARARWTWDYFGFTIEEGI